MCKSTVELTKIAGICCSCGICKTICPKSCIEYKREDGMYYPVVDNENCIRCGLCYDICPGVAHNYSVSDPIKAITGESVAACNAWSNNEEIRHNSASGGCISSLIVSLLELNEYDVATVLDTYSYDTQVKSTIIDKGNLDEYSKKSYLKSRYLPVSHEETVDFILKNKDKKVIITGTSCAIRGFLNIIEKYKLNRDNYLLVGLFCDKVFNYNIFNYFGTFADGKSLTSLHFKNKDSGGWPGNMKLFFDDGSFKFLDYTERMKMKGFFMPQRCLYCVDKVNALADISIGDNFTQQDSSNKGSNSVIIRTQRGQNAWNIGLKSAITANSIDIKAITDAQDIKARLNNAYFGLIKQSLLGRKGYHVEFNRGLELKENPVDFYRAYKDWTRKFSLGKNYLRNSNALARYIKRNKSTGILSRVSSIISRVYHKILRLTILPKLINK